MTMTKEEMIQVRDEAAKRERLARPRMLEDFRRIDEGGALRAELERVAALYASGPVQPAPACPALAPDEESCECDTHYLRGDRSARVCPLTWYKAARVRLSGELALCGYTPDKDALSRPIATELRAGLELREEVAGLAGLMDLVDAGLSRGFRGQFGHIALIGTPGTAKTHALLTLYFAALWEGIPARWVESAHLARLAKLRESPRWEESDQAQTELRTLRAAKILFIDDLGDRVTDPHAKTAGSSKYAALLLDLLNKYPGRVCWSSNLGIDGKDGQQLADHPDVGPRLLSRLLADHSGVPVLGASLDGLDQRRHVLRKQRRAARTVVSRLERTSDAA